MDSEVFDKARAIMERRRIDAVRENEKRISEVNEKIPQIAEINSQLFRTGKELISLITSTDEADAPAKIEQLRRNNMGAQAISEQLLAENGYPPDYLDMHYKCDKCSDTGYVGDHFCDCFIKLCGNLSAEKLNKNARLRLCGFDTFSLSYYSGSDLDTMKHIYEYAKQYAESFDTDSESILMLGKTGLGKTHLSLAIADTVLKRGYSAVYDSIINILQNIEREHFGREHSTETYDKIMDAELLILDDLGTEYETQFNNSTVYNIINTRMNRCMPTIISTNLDYAEIRRRYDARVVSRITAVYRCLEFRGEDVRFQKKRQQQTSKK